MESYTDEYYRLERIYYGVEKDVRKVDKGNPFYFSIHSCDDSKPLPEEVS